MVFSYTWNSAFLATPADTEDRSLGAQRIRDTKSAVGERLAVNHSLLGDGNDGKHVFVELLAQSSAPITTVGEGFLYTETVNSNVELFWKDSTGNILQLTSSGALTVASPIPSGTNMAFLQATVPVGWTLNTSFNDKVIRINSFVGGGTGGSWALTGMSVGGTTLSANTLPNFNIPGRNYQTSGGGTNSGWGSGGDNEVYWVEVDVMTTENGGQPHAHTFSNDSSWRPAYIDAVVGTKN